MRHAVVPIPLSRPERRELCRLLLERLGGAAASVASILSEPVRSTADAFRFEVTGGSGPVAVEGSEEAEVEEREGRRRIALRDRTAITGLRAGLALEVAAQGAVDADPGGEAAGPLCEDPAAQAALLCVLAVRGDGAEAKALLDEALREATRHAGRCAGRQALREPASLWEAPLGPSAEAARGFLVGGIWEPGADALEGQLDAASEQARLALLTDPRRRGGRLVWRGALPGGRRALVPLALLEADARYRFAAGRARPRAAEPGRIEKALTALAFDEGGSAPADPRPRGVPLERAAAEVHTAVWRLPDARGLKGLLYEPAGARGLRAAVLEAELEGPDGPIGALHERHLLGIQGSGFCRVAACGKQVAIAVGGFEEASKRWLARLSEALLL